MLRLVQLLTGAQWKTGMKVQPAYISKAGKRRYTKVYYYKGEEQEIRLVRDISKVLCLKDSTSINLPKEQTRKKPFSSSTQAYTRVQKHAPWATPTCGEVRPRDYLAQLLIGDVLVLNVRCT